jgi:hypothetical protein
MLTTTPFIRGRGVALWLGLLGAPLLACGADAGDASSDSASELTATGPIATSELVGFYDPTGALLHNPQIKDWGGSPLLSGSYLYGDALYPVDYVLQPTAADASQFTSESSMTVQYGPNRCSYPVQIQVNVTRDSSGAVNLFVRDNAPGSIPELLPVGAPCPHVQNTWRVHPSPYVKRGPTQVFASLLDELCTDVSARIRAVEGGKRLAAGPMGDVPSNIYAASGDWQALSTPGRDQQLRASFRHIFGFVTQTATGATAHDTAVQLTGIWNQHQSACRFEYKTSNGAPVPFTLNDVQSRLFDLSFDPYHCTEMRWGAFPDHVAEYATCNTQSDAHVKRFKDEKSLRNIIDRPPQGTPTPLGMGPAEHEDVDVVALLHRLAG